MRCFNVLLLGLVIGMGLSFAAFLFRSELMLSYKNAIAYINEIIVDTDKMELSSFKPPKTSEQISINSSYYPLDIRQILYPEIGDRRISAVVAVDRERFLIILNDGSVFLAADGREDLFYISNLFAESYPDNSLRKIFRAQLNCEDESLYVSLLRQDTTATGQFLVRKYSFNCDQTTLVSKAPIDLFISEGIPLKKIGSGYQGGGGLLLHEDHLYFSIGFSDGVGDLVDIVQSVALDKENIYGKTFKLNLNNGAYELFTLGHRNLQDIDFVNEKILSIEHGPQGGDELNVLMKSSSYGWPEKSYGTAYGTYTWHDKFEQNLSDGSLDPLFAFVPSIAPSSLINTEGTFLETRYDVIVGGLKSQSLFLVKLKEQRVVFVEPIFLGLRVRDLERLGKNLLVATDEGYLLVVALERLKASVGVNTDLRHYRHKELSSCLQCHAFQSGVNGIGPSLHGIYNRKVGKYPNFRYTSALENSDKVWNKQHLEEYILNPKKVYDSTSMPNLGLTSNEVSKIVNLLELY